MPKYVTNEFTFDLPESFHDRTLNIFSLTDHGPSEFGMVMARSAAPQGATLPEQMSKLLKQLEEQLTSFHLHERTRRLVGDIDAEEIRYSFSRNSVSLVQRQVALLLPNLWEGMQVMTITATFNEGSSQRWHTDFEALLDTIQIVR